MDTTEVRVCDGRDGGALPEGRSRGGASWKGTLQPGPRLEARPRARTERAALGILAPHCFKQLNLG